MMIFIQNIICFILGAFVLYLGTLIRQKVDNKENIKFPSISETVEKKRYEKKEREEINKLQDVMENINNYPNNQKEIR